LLLGLTPWRRGPLLLARRPGVALALAAATLVAVLPAAAAPLFLSSAQNATLHRQVTEACPWSVGVRVNNSLALYPRPAYAGPGLPIGDEVVRRRLAAVVQAAPVGLVGPVTTLEAQVNADPIDHAGNPDTHGLNLIGQPGGPNGFAAHVELVDGPAGTGLWVPDTFAQAQRLRVGDRVRLTSRQALISPDGTASTPYQLTVAAIFRDLRSLPDQPYWCTLHDVYRGAPGQEFTNTPIMPLALVDTGTFLAAGTSLRLRAVHTIEYAVADPAVDSAAAGELNAGIKAMRDRVFATDEQILAADFENRTSFSSLLDRQLRRARLVRSGLLPPVVPITLAGVLVGLAVVAAATAFWVQRRRQELTILAVHGVTGRALGLKAVAEALPAVLLGAAGGWAAAWTLVRWTGPGPVLSPGAIPLAGAAAAGTALVALLLVGVVAAARSRGLADQAPVSRAPRWWRRVPWEVVPLGLAPVAWATMAGARTVEATDGGVGEVAHVPARLLVVPILVIAGAAMLAGRVAAGWLRVRGLASTPRRPAGLLAWRRMVRDATATALLAGATAVPIATAAYGATVTDSIRTTADAEARTVLGSDVVAMLEPGQPAPALPAALSARATEVVRINGQSLDGLTVDVLLVDPATFAHGAFWDNRINGATLDAALRALSTDPVAGIVASSRIEPGEATLSVLDQDLPVQVVDTRPLPGEHAGYPLLLVHRDLVRAESPLASRQIWMRGDPTDSLAALTRLRLPLTRLTTVNDLRAGSVHEPVTFTFQYLIALSVFTGLIGTVGLLLYLESRTAAHRRAYVLLRRFGLRPGAHRAALLLELGVPVLIGLAAGLLFAAALAYGLGDAFEIDSAEPPGAILVLPKAMVAVVSATAVAVAVAAAALAHRRIRRANPSEVLRDAA
jgi:putative ABC transport system permease protein